MLVYQRVPIFGVWNEQCSHTTRFTPECPWWLWTWSWSRWTFLCDWKKWDSQCEHESGWNVYLSNQASNRIFNCIFTCICMCIMYNVYIIYYIWYLWYLCICWRSLQECSSRPWPCRSWIPPNCQTCGQWGRLWGRLSGHVAGERRWYPNSWMVYSGILY